MSQWPEDFCLPALVGINLATVGIKVTSPSPFPFSPPPELQLKLSRNVYSVAFSPDGKTALSGSYNGTVKWWDLSSMRVIKSLDAHSSIEYSYSVAFSPDGKTAL
ncbi:MAG: hypothetical protein ABFS56_34580, partial [Pseudomonadota bacterium]